MWEKVLSEAGFDALVLDSEHIRVVTPSGERVTYRIKALSWVPSPAQIPRPPDRQSLLVVPRATLRVLDAAEAKGWSIVTATGIVRLHLPTGYVRYPKANAQAGESNSPPKKPRHRVQWGTFTTVRALFSGVPQRQRELAAYAGISQARVSQVMTALRRQGLVRRLPDGYVPTDWDRLADWWLEHYPGPEGASSYWYSLEDLSTQALAAVEVLTSAQGNEPVLSGDIAADLVAPWRRPAQVVIYAHTLADLRDRDFVPAAGRADASVVLHAPRDPGVWPARRWRRALSDHAVALADGMQILYDLRYSSGPDAGEAAGRFRHWLRDRAASSAGAW